MKGFIFIFTTIICVQFLSAGYNIGNYYVSHPIKLTWFQASRFCTFYGQNLIDIPDEHEYTNILDVIKKVKEKDVNFNESIWTSGARFNDDKWFYWETTGMPVIYIDWGAGDPQMRPDENFIVLWNTHNYKPVDQYNNAKHVFMCRKRDIPDNRCDHCISNRVNCTSNNERIYNCCRLNQIQF